MAKKSVDVNALLGNLLGNLDKGVALDSVGKKPKKKKEKTLMDEAIAVPRLNKPSLKTTRLVMIVHRTTCECCDGVQEHANKYVLAEKVDKHGNVLQTQYISEDDKGVKREKEYVDSTAAMCLECFETGEVQPVMSQEAWDKTEPVKKVPSVNDLLKLVDSKVEEAEEKEEVSEEDEDDIFYEIDDVPDDSDIEELVDGSCGDEED